MGKKMSIFWFFLIFIYKVNDIYSFVNNNYNGNFNNSMVLSQQAIGPTTITSSGSLIWDGNHCFYKEGNNGILDNYLSLNENRSYFYFNFNSDPNSPQTNLKHWALGSNCNKNNCNFNGLLNNNIVYENVIPGFSTSPIIGKFSCNNPWLALPILKPNTVLWKNGFCFYTDGDEKKKSDGTLVTQCYYPSPISYQTWDFSYMQLNDGNQPNMDEANLCYKYVSGFSGQDIYVLPEQCNLQILNTKIIDGFDFYIGDENINKPKPTVLAGSTETYWNGAVCFYGQPETGKLSYYSIKNKGYSNSFSWVDSRFNPGGVRVVDPNSNKLYQNYIDEGCHKDSCQWSQLVVDPNNSSKKTCNKTQLTQLVPQGTSKALWQFNKCFYTRKTMWKEDNLQTCIFPNNFYLGIATIGNDNDPNNFNSGTVIKINVDDDQYCYNYLGHNILPSQCNVEFLDKILLSEIYFMADRDFCLIKDSTAITPINPNPKNTRSIDLIDFDLMATILNWLGKIFGIQSPPLPNKFYFIPYYLIIIGLYPITPFLLIIAEAFINFINLLILTI